MRQNSNRGFTLVEMVVVVCILAIVGSVVLSILNAGTNSYTRSSNNASLQKEAQLAMNQVQELLIDATNGVSYELDGTKVTNDNEFTAMEPEKAGKRTVCVFNRVVSGASEKLICSEVTWEKNSKRLFYAERQLIKNPTGGYNVLDLETDSLLAQNVEKFAVDLSRVESDGIVTVEMAFRLKDQTFEAKKNVTLRNKIVVNKSTEETYKNANIKLESTVQLVQVLPMTIRMDAGSDYEEFKASVTGENNPSQTVEWVIANVADLTDSSTTIDSVTGRVHIGTEETCKTIQIRAISELSKQKSGGDSSKWVYGMATIQNRYIRKDNPITVTNVKEAANLHTTAQINVNGANLEGTEDYANELQIEIYDGNKKLNSDVIRVVSLEKIESASVSEVSSYKLVLAGTSECANKNLSLKVGFRSKTITAGLNIRKEEIQEICIQAKNEQGKWEDFHSGAVRQSKRGERLELRLMAVYKKKDGTQERIPISCEDAEWNSVVWSLSSAAGASDSRIQNNIAEAGTLSFSGLLTDYQPGSSYTYSLSAQYEQFSVQTQLVLPVVHLQILNKSADTQCRVGIVTGNSDEKHDALLKFELSGMLVTPDLIQMSTAVAEGLHVEHTDGTDEYRVWAENEGMYTLTFYVQGVEGVQDSVHISANKPNVKNGTKTLPYFVPKSGTVATFFDRTQSDYHDLYGNTFTYPKEGVMKFDGDTYRYSTSKKVWERE